MVQVYFLILIRLMQNSERPGFPTFAALGKGRPTLTDGWLPLLPEVHLPRLTGQLLADVVHRKGVSAGGLDGWGWREFKVLPLSWFDELARILTKVEDLGVWPDGLLDASITMIPKTDGDVTPLGQRPLLLVCSLLLLASVVGLRLVVIVGILFWVVLLLLLLFFLARFSRIGGLLLT